MGGQNVCIVSVSTWDLVRIHFLSFMLGTWVVFRRFFKWLWNPNSLFMLQARDNPPQCLVDTTLGQHKYVKLKRVKLHYVESGSKEKPLMLLLHGFPDCWLTWRYQIPFFSEYFRVIALDLKGFGDSDKPLWRRSYKVETVLEELKQFISALGVSNCILVAHDLGALLGWYLVSQSPEIVDKFVAVSCPHPNVYWESMPSSGVLNSQWVKFTQWPYLPEIDALKDDLKIISDYHSHLHDKDYKDGEALEAYKYSFSRKEDWSGPINYFRNLPFNRINEQSDQIKVQTLLITGNKDQNVNLEGIVKSTDYCEKFFVKIIESTGHFPHQENPENFNKVIMKFLKVKVAQKSKSFDRSPTKGLMDRMFGAMSTTVKYGNSVLDSVNKRTNGVVPHLGLNLTHSIESTDL